MEIRGNAINGQRQRLSLLAALTFAATIATLALCLSVGAGKAWAGAQPGDLAIENLKGTVVVSLKSKAEYPDGGYRQYQSSKNPNKAISAAKSSNKKVATVKANKSTYNGSTYYWLTVQIKKAGTTKITYKFGGKKYSVKYKVKNYVNPLKKLKIGSKNYASKFNPKALSSGSDLAVASVGSMPKGKVSIKLKSGWKFVKGWYWKNNTMKYFKNGGKIPSGCQAIYLWVKKGNQRERLSLFA